MFARPLPPSSFFRFLAPPRSCTTHHSSLHTRHPHPRPQSRRTFHKTTRKLNNPTPDHYQVLKVPPDVSTAELKKQFYTLSKETHPDRNPGDPKAAERFAQISESYTVLANPEKRRKYDRDVMRTRPSSSAAGPRGYAGSRAPTGLSKRRGAFKGPPPSYYTHGNPSGNTARQSETSTRSSSGSSNAAGTFNASAFAPEGQYDPAFDPSKIYKTQTVEDTRRQTRRQAEMAAAQADAEDSNFWARFVILTTIVVAGVTVASLLANMAHAPRGGLTRPDGTRRDAPPRTDLSKV